MFTSSFVLSSFAAFGLLSNVASAASLVKVPEFGSPVPGSKVEMFIYVPDKLAPNPPIVMDVSSITRFHESFVDLKI
jgi:hypothetical protein